MQIQRVQRGIRPRRRFQEITAATVAIQRRWRWFQWQLYEQQCTGGAIAAQQIGRGWLVRHRMKRLGRFFQAVLLRRSELGFICVVLYAIISTEICVSYRQGQAMIRQRVSNIVKIQRRVQKHLQRLGDACTKVQCLFRGHVARCEMAGFHALATIAQVCCVCMESYVLCCLLTESDAVVHVEYYSYMAGSQST